jgi:hypothetical protein
MHDLDFEGLCHSLIAFARGGMTSLAFLSVNRLTCPGISGGEQSAATAYKSQRKHWNKKKS